MHIRIFYVAYPSIHILQSYDISHSLYDLNTPLFVESRYFCFIKS